MSLRRALELGLAVLLGPALCNIGIGQVPGEDAQQPASVGTVRWSAAVISPFGAAGQGIEATLKVAADIRDGWHVYGQPAAKAA